MHVLCNTLLSISQVVGEELSPGVKKGGYLNLIQRRINCVGPASAIPKELELDVSSLDFGDRITLSGLNLPAEVSIAGVVNELPLHRSIASGSEHRMSNCMCVSCSVRLLHSSVANAKGTLHPCVCEDSGPCAGGRASHLQAGREGQPRLMSPWLYNRP